MEMGGRFFRSVLCFQRLQLGISLKYPKLKEKKKNICKYVSSTDTLLRTVLCIRINIKLENSAYTLPPVCLPAFACVHVLALLSFVVSPFL